MLSLFKKRELFTPNPRPYTPDAVQLEFREFHRLFVADELCSHQANNHKLGAASVKLSDAYTKDSFSFFKHDRIIGGDLNPASGEVDEFSANIITEEIGIPLPDMRSWSQKAKMQTYADREYFTKLRGELYLVRPKKLFELDIYRENLVQFKRKRVHIIVPHFEQGTNAQGEEFVTGPKVAILLAWMYIGNREYWDKNLDAGFRFRRAGLFSSNRRWLKDYYDFNEKGYRHLKGSQ